MSQEEGLVQQFKGITGVDGDVASIYLEHADWNVEVCNIVL